MSRERAHGEDHGLLGGAGSWEELDDYPSPRAARRPSSIRSDNGAARGDANGGLRTPRTPMMKVRFDLPDGDNSAADAGDSIHGRDVEHGGAGAQDPLDDDGDARHSDEGHSAPLLPSASTPLGAALAADEAGVPPRATSSLQAAVSNMSNSILGAGIIGQPYAFKEAGLATGVLLLVTLTVVVDWTIRLIVVNSKLSGRSTFQGTVEFCFGRWGLLAISAAQWAFAFGGMVAFAVIVGDSIPPVMQAVWPGVREVKVLGWLAGRTGAIVVFVGGISWPLSLYRDISKLAKASTLALISMLIIIITVVTQGFSVPPELRGTFGVRLWTINDGIFQAIGVISFAFVCHHNTLLIYSSLTTPTLSRFSLLTHISTTISLLACLAMALSGFLTFGSLTSGNVLNNFPSSPLVNLARFCFGLNMLTTLPLEAFVCREVTLNYFWPHPDAPAHTSTALHVALTTALVAAAAAIATQICDLGAVFELIGATSASVLAYILPPLCYLKLSRARDWRRPAAWAVVAFGCTVAAMTLLMSVAKLWTGEHAATVQCR